LEGLSNRGYTAGFLERRPANDYQNYETGSSEARRSQFVGEVKAVQDGWAEVETKNRFSVGDTLEIIHPQRQPHWCELDADARPGGRGTAIRLGQPAARAHSAGRACRRGVDSTFAMIFIATGAYFTGARRLFCLEF
jgi:hypothetical protein